MRFEKELQEGKAENSNIEKQLIEEYTVIYDRLRRLEENELIDYNYLHDLISLTTRLIEVVSRGNPSIMREVSVMGDGKVLEMESEKIYNRGLTEGISETIIEFLSEYGAVPEELKERICNEKDTSILKQWNKLSARVSSIEEFVERM